MQAANNFVQIKAKDDKGTFVNSESNLREGTVISIGSEKSDIKKKDTVVFDTFKALQYSIKGQDYYFVKLDTIIAYESNK